MKLSDLHTGQIAVIAKVSGHGGFRKRIVEMGFIKGTKVKVVLNAPLKDPIEYELMGYKISLRRAEAALVEVVSETEAKENFLHKIEDLDAITPSLQDQKEIELRMHKMAEQEGHTIKIALVGNPNCGKTSLFNSATGSNEHVGNYSGVTVDSRTATFTHIYNDEENKQFEKYKINLIDLPGTYSLSTFCNEEAYVRQLLIEETPDIIINVVDATNLERNLYLTTQLLDFNIRMVVALNMYDEFKLNNDQLDLCQLEQLLGTPFIPTISRTGEGIDELFNCAIRTYEGKSKVARHIHVNHGPSLENGINRIKESIQKNEQIRYKYSTRYLAIRLLEGDAEYNSFIDTLPNHDEVVSIRYEEQQRIVSEHGCSAEEALVNAKYGFIQGALRETYHRKQNNGKIQNVAERIDSIVTHQWLGFPLLFLLLYLTFETTFTLGEYPMQWLESLVNLVNSFITFSMPEGMFRDLLTDGIIGGVGSVIVFLPNILILYLLMSLLEDSGYMARAAFITDKLMHHIGLHGKSVIPLIMGFGCNVPAVMATRTIEHPRSRLLTMLILPFMSCSARLPVYILFIGAFFPQAGGWGILLLYLIGIAIALILAKVLSHTLPLPSDVPFVMELPPYRIPTWRSIFRHTWEKAQQYLRKMGGLILAFSIIIWALSYFSPTSSSDADESQMHQSETSYLAMLGKGISPIFSPMDYDWKLTVGILSGIGAKELVVSSLGVLYAGEDFDESNEHETINLSAMLQNNISVPTAVSFVIFVLLYLPCIATIVAIAYESGSWKWGAFSALLSTSVAYVMAVIAFQITALCV
ncbi:MAG: ferrous iron transport protein B [Bacteroidaceae bacterium]|nr:ferrous iron transport protein B [Bacteroidaceae bacterium]